MKSLNDNSRELLSLEFVGDQPADLIKPMRAAESGDGNFRLKVGSWIRITIDARHGDMPDVRE